MVNLGLDISHIILEKGLELRRENSDWLSTSNCHKPVTCEPSQISANYHLRPIVLTVNLTSSVSHCFLAPYSTGRLLEIEMSELTQIAPFQNGRFIMQSLDLSYTVGAVIHHCHQLAQAYVKVCQEFSHIPLPSREIPNPCVFSDQPEPYYAFEALTTAAMRFYMTARRPIWAAFGLGGPTPNSFEAVLARCSNLPIALQERLEQSWSQYGRKLKEYRDCIEHYVQLGGAIPSVSMEQLDNGLWLAWLRIPDNPQVRSAKAFRYDSKLDALTYGWTVADEVVKLAHTLIKQLPND
jgi:hypothetical protein